MTIFLTDGKDLDGIKRSNDIFYMKVLKYCLKIIAAWPETDVGETEPRYKKLLLAVNMMFFVTGLPCFTTYLIKNQGKIDFFQIGHVYISLFMNIVALSRQLLPFFKNYRDLSGYFVTKLHLFYHKDRSEYAMKIHLMVHKLSHFYTMYAITCCVCGILLFNLTPLLNNLQSGALTGEKDTYELALYYTVPKYDLERNFNAFLIATFVNFLITVICSAAFVCIDLYLSLMIFHLWGHLKILKHELETFPMPSDNKLIYDEQEADKILARLKKEVDYHRFIMNFADTMSNTFGLMLLIFYAYHQVSGCLLLLECSQLDTKALLRYGPLTLILFQQLIQLSCIFEMLGTQSEKLIDASYSMPWECMDARNRMVTGFFLQKLQTPISVKAMGVANVGVQTMASILKTSFSYFAFLRTKNE